MSKATKQRYVPSEQEIEQAARRAILSGIWQVIMSYKQQNINVRIITNLQGKLDTLEESYGMVGYMPSTRY